MLLNIPVKSVVKKYLAYEYPNGFKVSLSTHVGSYLLMLLRSPVEWEEFHQYVQDSDYDTKLAVEIADKYVFGIGANKITPFLIYRFSNFIEELVKLEIFIMIDTTGNISESINTYMQEMNLTDEDISVDALKKMCQRKRKRKEQGQPYRLQFGLHHYLKDNPVKSNASIQTTKKVA